MSSRTGLSSLPFNQWGLGIDNPLFIAGPCSAESPEQVLETAQGIVEHAPQVRAFRAGIWKPRTRPGGFEGVGDQALDWLKEAKRATGLLTLVEVATPEHVTAALNAGVDILWIGARTTPNPFSVQAIADALKGKDVPVLVKNPMNPDLQLWIGALERIAAAGITRLAAIHRGFNWFERTPYRNSPMWEFPIRLKAAFPGLEVICDPSHIAGDPEKLGEIAQQALDLNFSGLMVETHRDPGSALSDARQQVTPPDLRRLLDSLIVRDRSSEQDEHQELRDLRDLIDQLDEEIIQKLGTRMGIAERIGEFKQRHNMAILQPERWERIMRRLKDLRDELGLSERFVEEFMNAVHQESIRHQTQVTETGTGIPSDRVSAH